MASNMNAVQAVRSYIDKMIQSSGPGMKILLLDKDTTSVVSNVYSQSEIMQNEVYLCDKLDNRTREPLRHLKCLTFLRPTEENVAMLSIELKNPLYGQYFLYWTNIISKTDVKRLAEADEQEVVREITEIFTDFIPINPHTFVSNTTTGPIFANGDSIMDDKLTYSISQSIVSFLLATKRIPYLRYTEGSHHTQKIADRVQRMITKETQLFDFKSRQHTRPVLLILDRRDDCVTPLLNQWTYQAMVHELLTIRNHRVSLADAVDIPKDFREVVLSPENDRFFADNMYCDFGLVGQNLKVLVEEFQTKVKSHQKVESINDMKSFIENYPHFKQMSGTVSKHVAVVGEIARLNEKYSLLEVSELEQEIACHSNHSASLQRLKQLISSPKLREKDILRLVLLYALKFESHSNNDIVSLVSKLRSRGEFTDEEIGLVQGILKFGGIKKRKSDLFGTDPVAVTKRFMKGLQGVENIYTQHTPWMKAIVEDLLKGKLKDSLFPYHVAGENRLNLDPNYKPPEAIIFIVGGVTYEEALAVHNINRAENRVAVTLGGTEILNMNLFLEEAKAFVRGKKPVV